MYICDGQGVPFSPLQCRQGKDSDRGGGASVRCVLGWCCVLFVNLGHLDYFNSLRRVTASRSFDDVYRPLLRVQYQAIGLLVLHFYLHVPTSPTGGWGPFRFPVAVCLAAASFLFRSISSVIPGSLLVLCPWCTSPLVCPLRSAIFLHLFCATRQEGGRCRAPTRASPGTFILNVLLHHDLPLHYRLLLIITLFLLIITV